MRYGEVWRGIIGNDEVTVMVVAVRRRLTWVIALHGKDFWLAGVKDNDWAYMRRVE